MYTYNLGQAFKSVAAANESRVALRYPDGSSFTYGEIDLLSDRLAFKLYELGLRKGDVAAIFNNKTHLAYCLMLACIKRGIIYTNLDDTSPAERIRKIVNTCNPKAVFFDKEVPEIRAELQSAEIPLGMHSISAALLPHETERIPLEYVHGGEPVYIMFTSGSTGFPKGAVMSHNNVLNFIQWGQETFGVTPEDIFTNANPIYFDNSVFDFYTSLFSGASLVPLDATIVRSPANLVSAINNSGCTIWFSVPSLLVYLLTTRALKPTDFSSIKRISFGGEGFPKNRLKQLYEMFGHRIKLFNVYGPTECTCICSSYVISPVDFENMSELAPLGFMAPNFGYEILPLENDNPDLGELALTGPCVGLGYYNDPERSAKSFVQNETRRFHQRMYKTGDLVWRAPNGYLHFKGRVDNQIKHMGYRIELEEIEAAFSTMQFVNESGVIYEKLTAELGQIKAFVSVSDKSKTSEEIQALLKGILPPYMIPKIVILDVLPKNQNGKIDRRQLATMK